MGRAVPPVGRDIRLPRRCGSSGALASGRPAICPPPGRPRSRPHPFSLLPSHLASGLSRPISLKIGLVDDFAQEVVAVWIRNMSYNEDSVKPHRRRKRPKAFHDFRSCCRSDSDQGVYCPKVRLDGRVGLHPDVRPAAWLHVDVLNQERNRFTRFPTRESIGHSKPELIEVDIGRGSERPGNQ